MNRSLFAVFFLLIISHLAHTQSGLPFGKEVIASDLERWSLLSDSVYGHPQHIQVIAVGGDYQFDLAWASDTLIRTSAFAKAQQAVAAINGGFFDMQNGGSVTFQKADRKIIDTTVQRLIDQDNEILEGAVIIDRRGRLHIRSTERLERMAPKRRYPDILVTGPLLLLNGEAQPLVDRSFTNDRHPRSCVCTTESGRRLLITIDGRHDQAAGMSLSELTRLARDLNCRDAINLDGGGSTTLYLRGAGVINHPSDNRSFDNKGERPCANAILVLPG